MPDEDRRYDEPEEQPGVEGSLDSEEQQLLTLFPTFTWVRYRPPIR